MSEGLRFFSSLLILQAKGSDGTCIDQALTAPRTNDRDLQGTSQDGKAIQFEVVP
jgi:hypothetical protein